LHAYVTDLIDRRLEVARQCGADWTANAHNTDAASQLVGREPLGLDVVFECSAIRPASIRAVKLLGPGGTLMLVGIAAPERLEFDHHTMRRKELTFKSVRRQRGCVAPVIEMIASAASIPARW